MGASNHPDLAFPKGVGRPVDAELEERKAKAHEREVYITVDNRDKKRCLCCRRRGNTRATTMLGKIHHDHILERSLGGVTETWNIASMCSICHEFKTAHQIEPFGDPDLGTLTFTITRRAADVVFSGRALPSHVRLMEAK